MRRTLKEKKKPWCSYLAAKYLSNGKNGLTNPPLKYPVHLERYYLNASFLRLALPKNPILALGNVIGISSPKFFFSMKARDGKCCSKFCLIP